MTEPYHSKLVDTCLFLERPTCLRMYFIDILGREPQEDYEWEKSGLGIKHYANNLPSHHDFQGIVGVVAAFPHVTALFRFGGPDRPETSLFRTSNDTKKFHKIPHQEYEDGAIIVACLGEIPILDHEIKAWAKALSVDEYAKAPFLEESEIKVRDHEKLQKWLREG